MLPLHTTFKSLAFLSLIIFTSCSNNSKNRNTEIIKATEKPAENISIKFTRDVVPDTSGCGWFFNDRQIKDTLKNEMAIIKKIYTFSTSSSGTLLATKKYRNLLACSIPSFLIKSNDTILISGYIYWVSQSEDPPGYPIYITNIIY